MRAYGSQPDRLEACPWSFYILCGTTQNQDTFTDLYGCVGQAFQPVTPGHESGQNTKACGANNDRLESLSYAAKICAPSRMGGS